MRRFLPSLTAPFRGAALVVNVTFALAIALAIHAGMFGLPALVILVPWFLKYTIVVGREAAWGRDELPTLSLDNLNPLELQPIVLALGMGTVYGGAHALAGPLAGALVLALAVPACIGAVIAEDRVLAAFNPVNLLDYVRGLGSAYVVIAAALALAGALSLQVLRADLGPVPTLFLLQSILIACFHGTGRLLHARERQIGYDRPDTHAETEQRWAARANQRDLDDRLQHWYGQCEVGKHERAFEEAREYLDTHEHDLILYDHLFEHMVSWRDPTLGLALGRDFMARLLRADRPGKALEVLLHACDIDLRVRPIGERDTLRLARDAARAKRADVALALLEDFEERFPESRFVAVALVNRARLLLQQARPTEAATAMQRIAREHPDAMKREEVARLQSRIRRALARESPRS